MKKRFYLAAFAAMALMSCNEKTVNVQEMPEQAGTVELKVKVPAASTRLTGEAADEDKISNLQVFVFNESDALEAYGNEDAESLSLTCVPGKKQVVALVNAPSLSDISKLSDLQAEVSYLSDNEAGALVMASEPFLHCCFRSGALPNSLCWIWGRLFLCSPYTNFSCRGKAV